MRQRTTCTTARLLLAALTTLTLAACGDEGAQDVAAAAVEPAPTTGAATAEVPGNSAPTITGTPELQADAAGAYVFQPSAVDADGDTLTFTAVGLPAWASIDAGTGRVSGSPAADDSGETADIELAVSDGKVTTALATFKINVVDRTPARQSTPGSSAPVISGVPVTSVTAGTGWTFAPTATDRDSLVLTWSIANKPSWASFSTTTGKLTGTPTAAQVATYPNIVVSVSDGANKVSLPAFTLVVKPVPNGAPTISGSPATTATVGTAYSFRPVAADPDKQALGFTITNKPTWASFSTATGALTGTPGQGNVGTTSGIVIAVSDGTTTTRLAAFSIAVKAAPNGAPTIGGTPSTTGKVGIAWSFTPTAADPNGDKLTFSITGKPSWATFNAATGALTGTPTASGSYNTIVISVSDGTTSTALNAFSVLVSASTGSASLSWTPPTTNVDGSTLTNLAGYRIYYGTSQGSLSQSIQVTNPGLTSYTVGNLTSGTYYFSVAAYTADGIEGAVSGVGSATIL